MAVLNEVLGGASLAAPSVSRLTVATYARDDFGRSVTDGWGTADLGGSYTLSGGTASEYDVTGSVGTIVPSNDSTDRTASLSIGRQDIEALVRFKTDKVPTGSAITLGLAARYQDASNYYYLRVRCNTDQSMDLQAIKFVAASTTTIATASGVDTHSADQYYWLRIVVSGTSPTTLKGRIWQDGQAEPGAWDVNTTDSEAGFQTSGDVATVARVNSAVTNAPILFSFDSLLATNGIASLTVAPGVLGPAVVRAPEQISLSLLAPPLLGGASVLAPKISLSLLAPALLGGAVAVAPTVVVGAATVAPALLGGAQVLGPFVGGSVFGTATPSISLLHTVAMEVSNLHNVEVSIG